MTRDDDPVDETPELVGETGDVTPEWLTRVLRHSGAAPEGASVTAFDSQAIGTGKLGENVRFTLSWSGADPEAVPASVVGKFASADPTSRQAGIMTGIYVREIAFYQELASQCAMRIPTCHLAEIDLSTAEFVLMFEDITPAQQGDQVTGCSVDQAALAMEQLALLHSSFWANRVLDGREWLTPRSAEGGQGLATIYVALLPQFLEQYDDRLSDRARETAIAFAPDVGTWLSADRKPFTLLHGDYRLENMLFGTGPDAPPLTTVDWQTVSIGPGPSDAAYFLGAGLHTEERRSHERELLETYRTGLVANGVELGASECWDLYRANTFAGLHMAVVASVLVGRDPRADEMFLAMAERHAAHVVDLEALSLFD